MNQKSVYLEGVKKTKIAQILTHNESSFNKLAFRYVQGDYCERYYLNYKNFSNVDLVKVIECDNQVRAVAVIDSSKFFLCQYY